MVPKSDHLANTRFDKKPSAQAHERFSRRRVAGPGLPYGRVESRESAGLPDERVDRAAVQRGREPGDGEPGEGNHH